MHRPGSGPGTQPLRAMPGFPGQQPQPNRINPLAPGRLQNGKMGNAPSWGFGMPNGAPGLANPQARTPGIATTSFAQTLGGAQPSTPLDLSEFPSLSGAPQPQFQNPNQAVWASANQRATHTPVQRPQQTSEAGSSQQPNRHIPDQVQQTLDDAFLPGSQLDTAIDDYRHGGQGGIGQLSTQPGSIDEFPPLNRNGQAEGSQDRRVNMMQNAASGGFANAPGYVSGAGGPAGLRASNDAIRQLGGLEQDKASPIHPTNGNEASIFSSLNDVRPEAFAGPLQLSSNAQSQAHAVQQQQLVNSFADELSDSPPGTQRRPRTPLDQMSELDRYGLRGLLEMIRSDNPDVSSLAIGQDLTALGLDLNSTEPLYPTFAGPFANGPARPFERDFNLPPCYTVHNTHRLEEKVPSFSDETLFYMFYTMTRDVMQEVAAQELTQRNWRYHKVLKVWLTKDAGFADPQPISNEAERGRYVVFNEKVWQRESRDMIIHWCDLDDHITNGQQPRVGLP